MTLEILLVFSRWPQALGHNAWVTHSEIAVAEGPSPFGPFTFKTVALPARGKRFWDGLCTPQTDDSAVWKKYYLYYMGGTGDGVAREDPQLDVAIIKSRGCGSRSSIRSLEEIRPANRRA